MMAMIELLKSFKYVKGAKSFRSCNSPSYPTRYTQIETYGSAVVGKHRKAVEYGNSILAGFVPVDSSQLPVLFNRNRSEIIGENSEDFRPEYCFHKITGIARNRPFPAGSFDLSCAVLHVGLIFGIRITDVKCY